MCDIWSIRQVCLNNLADKIFRLSEKLKEYNGELLYKFTLNSFKIIQ
jgi:hypothetical protein